MCERMLRRGVVWVVLLGLLGLLCSCDQGPSQAELDIAEQARTAKAEAAAMRKKEQERKRWKAEFAEREEKAKKEREKAKKLAKKQKEKEAEEKALVEKERELEIDWKDLEDKMFARGSMANVVLGNLRTRTGKTYKEAEVKGASSVGITIYHQGGVDDVEYADLFPDLQKKFLYDPEEAADFKAGKRIPRLPADRRRAVQDRIGEVLTAQYEAEVAEMEERIQDRKDAEELRRKAKIALAKAEDVLVKIQGMRKADPNRERRQKALIARYRKIMIEADTQMESLRNGGF